MIYWTRSLGPNFLVSLKCSWISANQFIFICFSIFYEIGFVILTPWLSKNKNIWNIRCRKSLQVVVLNASCFHYFGQLPSDLSSSNQNILQQGAAQYNHVCYKETCLFWFHSCFLILVFEQTRELIVVLTEYTYRDIVSKCRTDVQRKNLLLWFTTWADYFRKHAKKFHHWSL